MIDGDTFEARVQVWPGLAMTTKVRLRGIDAAEMNGRCAEERSKAEAALAALNAILAEPDLTVFRVSLDKYGGRVLAEAATSRTPDVSQALLRGGVARPYAGGRREPWCAILSFGPPHFARRDRGVNGRRAGLRTHPSMLPVRRHCSSGGVG